MNAFTIFLLVIALLILSWAVWFLLEFLRYLISGEYHIDKRLRDICK
ncbi:MAG TPA: hypothetical protein PLN86_15625 [Candidatus Hydrogenedentes bacterium]|nr:hypothetical protein [Candidatus Hydrogenedentota bacterium]